MKTTFFTLAFLVATQSLVACSEQLTHPTRGEPALVSSSHSIYIEGGVLKVFADEEQNMLYLYVRPEVLNNWVTSGGGGGNQANPWHHKSSMYWSLGDEHGHYLKDGPQKAFTCLFDSRHMTLTIETGTYAVRRGDFVVIALDENWHPSVVKSGIESLRVFDLPEEDRKHLISASRKYYNGT